MKITKNGLDTMAGPGDWFAGEVHIDVVSMPSPTSRVMAGYVTGNPAADLQTQLEAVLTYNQQSRESADQALSAPSIRCSAPDTYSDSDDSSHSTTLATSAAVP